MRVETLSDLMDWTRSVHQRLAEALERDTEGSRDERLHMLADYLSEHERMLARVLKQSEEDTQKKTLDTWTYEFFRNIPLKARESFDFHNQDPDHLLGAVLDVHEKIIGLYRDLAEHAEVESTRELLENLRGLEKHEAMRMARDYGRMKDL